MQPTVGGTSDAALSKRAFSIVKLKRLIDWLTLPGWFSAPFREIHMQCLPRSDAGREELLQQMSPGKPVVVVLPTKAVLQKELSLPSKARSQSAGALELQKVAVEEQSQTPLIAVLGTSKRQGTKTVYSQYFAKISDIEWIRSIANSTGCQVARILVATDRDVSVLWEGWTALSSLRRFWWSAFFIVVLVYLGLQWQHERVAAAQIQELFDRVRLENAALEDELNRSASERLDFRDQLAVFQVALTTLSNEQNVTWSLARLSDIVPEQVWLREFVWSSGFIRVSGTSSIEPTSLVQTLENEDWINGVSLVQPIRTDRLSGKSSFEFQLDTVWDQVR